MFRETHAILDNTPDVAQLDADVIMTATMAGFCAGRLAAGEPVAFSADPDKPADLESLRHVVHRLDGVMPAHLRGRIEAVTAPPWTSGSLITGTSGGARLRFGERDIPLSDNTARTLRDIAASEDEKIGYRGIGAYTGLMNDPVGRTSFIASTFRENISPDEGSRWVWPSQIPWGLIDGADAGGDMPAEPLDGAKLVGYVHGMTFAVYRALAQGPWCVPYEIAVGTKTTKLASCFGCTLFMYANGFPPSNIHLGRAESWAPLHAARRPGKHDVMDDVIDMTKLRWSLECRQQTLLGAKLLLDAAGTVEDQHRERLPLISTFLDEHSEDPLAGGHLVLDALTAHDKESERVLRTLAG